MINWKNKNKVGGGTDGLKWWRVWQRLQQAKKQNRWRGGGTKQEEKQLPLALQQQKQEEKKQEEKKQEAPKHPKTVDIGENGIRQRVKFDEYRKQLLDHPMSQEAREIANRRFDGNLGKAATYILTDMLHLNRSQAIDDLGITKALYTYKDLAKAWYRGIAKQLHSDSSGDYSTAATRAMAELNDIYRNMVRYGK